MNEQILEMSRELEDILARINGAKRVQGGVTLQYIVVLEDESARENAEMVANTLTEQAEAHNVSLEITCATESQLEEARARLESLKEEN